MLSWFHAQRFQSGSVMQEFVPVYQALALAERHCGEGRFADAEMLCRRALEVQPNSYEAEQLLGTILYRTGKLNQAIAHFRRTAELAPQVAVHHANLGELYRLVDRMDEAVAASRRALDLNPQFPEPLNNLARIALARGDCDRALAYCRQAILFKPDFADAHCNLGSALKERGDIDEARRAYLKAIALDPNNVGFYVNLAEVHGFVRGDPQLAVMEALAAKADSLPMVDRLNLDFALGRAYADLKDYGRSFQYFLAGNARKRALVSYDEKSMFSMFDNIEHIFTPELIKAKSGYGNPSRVPIFVLGMPRSGTTLTEQILASHPMVHGADELTTFQEIVLNTPGPDGHPVAGPRLIPALDTKAFAEIGTRYVAAISDLAPGVAHIVNKRPNNYFFIGLIHLTLPNAKIIHVFRNPFDTCVSCFSKLFTVTERSELNHTYDLAELGRYYKRYERLMAHWRQVLPPGSILDVRYEDVVADLEGQARRMFDHCELSWDDRCLAFHTTKRPVRTASAVQVRQPIYDSSVGRWRVYEEFLGPLIAELNSANDDVGGNTLAGGT
jgi:Flp pilus assembly protein TadD